MDREIFQSQNINSMKKINLSAIIMLSIVLFAAGCTGTGERTVGTVGTTGLDAVSTDALTPDRPKVAVLLTEGFQMPSVYAHRVPGEQGRGYHGDWTENRAGESL